VLPRADGVHDDASKGDAPVNARLTTAIDEVARRLNELRSAHPALDWVAGDGRVVRYRGGGFEDIPLKSGESLTLTVTLTPEEAARHGLTDELEFALDTLYPAEFFVNGASVFREIGPGVSAAPSPALVEAVAVPKGEPLELKLRVDAPPNQLMTWWVRVTMRSAATARRIEDLDAVWAYLSLAEALATDEDRAHVDRAVEAVLGGALEPAALRAAVVEPMRALAPRFAPYTAHMVGHCHIDLSWLWTWEDTERVILRDFRAMADILEDYPEATITHSQIASYEVIREQDPELFARVRRLIDAGRWEASTVSWVELDNNLPSIYGLRKQMSLAADWNREHLGVAPTVYMAPDNFGHTANLPQLARSGGAQFYFHHRAIPSEDPWPAYHWRGIDGSEILALTVDSYNGDLGAGLIVHCLRKALKWGHREALVVHGVGNHGGGPARRGLDIVRRLQDDGILTFRHSTLETYGRALLATGVELPQAVGGSRTIFEGCYTSEARSKALNARHEWLLTAIDGLTAFSGDGTSDLEGVVAESWKAVLLNHFHDIVCGSSIAEVYDRQDAELRDHQERIMALLGSAGTAVKDLTVVNPWGFPVEAVIPLSSSAASPVVGSFADVKTGADYAVVEVPAYGSRRVADAAPAGGFVRCAESNGRFGGQMAVLDVADTAEAPYYRIETGFYEAFVRRDSGAIVSLRLPGRDGLATDFVEFGMKRGSDYLDAARVDLGLNVLSILEERDHGMSAWHHGDVFRETLFVGCGRTTVDATSAGSVVLRTEFEPQLGMTVTQFTTFHAFTARIDVRLAVEVEAAPAGTAALRNLKATFAARVADSETWVSVPGGAVQPVGVGGEIPTQRWMWAGNDDLGLAVLSVDRHGADVLGSRMRLSLLRTPVSPDEVADLGSHEIRYALLPGSGSWRDQDIPRVAEAYAAPVFLRSGDGASGNGVRIDGTGLIASPWQRAAEGSTVDVAESHGRTSVVTFDGLPAGSELWQVELDGRRARRIDASEGSATDVLEPWKHRRYQLIG
jgi:alpha-mannosidase